MQEKITGKQVLAYALLPGIIPRVKSFAENGFGWLAYLMAVLYSNVKLLPADHPYLKPANRGRYGIRHVIAQAANNLVFKRSNIDQIVIFFTLLTGFVLLVSQCALLCISLVFQMAHAAGPSFGGGMFSTPYPQDDIAFTLLDKVLGVPGVFALQNTTPFHNALHGLFQFYSLAMLIVAVIIVLYYVVVIVGETAQTGTPFGKRFSHIWAPIRLVVALGLLVPVAYGLNSGQYIALYAAKMGSGLATNGWLMFNTSLRNGLGVSNQSLVARPSTPDVAHIIKSVAIARTCKEAYERSINYGNAKLISIDPYLVKNPMQHQKLSSSGAAGYDTAMDFYQGNDVVIRFGATEVLRGNRPSPGASGSSGNSFIDGIVQDSMGGLFPGAPSTGGSTSTTSVPLQANSKRFVYSTDVGGVRPFCGEIVVRTNSVNQIGAEEVQRAYYDLVMRTWNSPAIDGFAKMLTYRYLPNVTQCDLSGWSPLANINCDEGINTAFIKSVLDNSQAQFDAAVVRAREQMLADESRFAVPQDVLRRGWGGAGIWYNRLAQWNGALFGAVFNSPSVNLLPIPMIKILDARKAQDRNDETDDLFSPRLADGSLIDFGDSVDAAVAIVLHRAYVEWGTEDLYMESDMASKQNIIIDTLNYIFGIGGLFSIRENSDIHPLAQMTGIGKSIVDSSVRNLFAATISSAGAGFLSMFPKGTGSNALGMMSGIFVSLATVGLSVGFILYYVVPFMPFIYFFFAVGSWLKTIFEAMVGIPLWALAHLKIDGDGLPGGMAVNGYFLIFEIFIRPILTVFGLLASVIIFSAMVRMLHDIFPLVTANMTGFDGPTESFLEGTPLAFKRSVIDEFFFTILYTILIYMMAMSSFKLIDQIPKGILRWMGSGAQSFSDHSGGTAEGMVQYAAMGGYMMTNQLTGALTKGATAAGQVAGGVTNAVVNIGAKKS